MDNKKERKRLLPAASQSMTYSHINTRNGNGNGTDGNTFQKVSRSFTYHFYPPVEEQDPAEEGPVAPKSSIFLMIFINFLANVVFSIVLPSLPNFIKIVGGEEYLNGWAVAVNSFGTFLASPIFGYWADKRNFREVFFLTLLALMAGNVWYALATDMYQLFAARFLVGIAAANFTVANSYLAYATSSSERAKVMTWNSGSTALGFICGPSFSSVTSLPALSFSIPVGTSFVIRFSPETAPGWVSALFALIGLFCLIGFHEVPRKSTENKKIDKLQQPSMRSFRSLTHISQTRMPWKGVMVCLLLSFTLTAAFTIMETLGPLYVAANPYTKWGVFPCSILFLGISVVSLIALVVLQGLLLVIPDERILEVAHTLLLTCGMVFIFDWNDGFVNVPRLLSGVALITVGFVNGQALLLAIFSKVLEEHEQGMMMGWLSSAGSISRMSIPIGASYAWKYVGPNYCFLGCAALIFVTTVCVLVWWRDLVSATKATDTAKAIN